MPTPKKAETVEELKELLERATVAIATDHRGLKVSDLTALRRKLREAGVEYHVVKNTLARLAAEQLGRPAYNGIVQGPTALAIGFGDQSEVARALTEYVRTSRLNLPIRGGVLDSRVLTGEDITVLATLPSREVLIGQVMGGIQAPLVGLASVLNAVLAGFVRVLDAHAKQLEGAS